MKYRVHVENERKFIGSYLTDTEPNDLPFRTFIDGKPCEKINCSEKMAQYRLLTGVESLAVKNTFNNIKPAVLLSMSILDHEENCIANKVIYVTEKPDFIEYEGDIYTSIPEKESIGISDYDNSRYYKKIIPEKW